MRKIKLILIFSLGLILAVSGCKKRKNPVEPVVLKQFDYFKITNNLWPALDNSPLGVPFSIPTRTVMVYIPGEVPVDSNGQIPISFKTKYPVLYLLTDFGQDALVFANTYRVKDIADKLIANGEIKPMIIVIADGNNPMGGGFYLNSIGGNYEKYIAEDLRLQIDTLFFSRIVNDSTKKRGISGVGMGGYGAFRVAMDYPQFYGSVSAISAPLSIGAGPNGDWFTDYLRATAIQEGLQFSSGDSVIIPPDKTKPAISLLFALSLGFSHHDTADTDSSSYIKIGGFPTDNSFVRYGLDLPFDTTGTIRPSIWTKWLNNDIKQRISNNPTALNNTKIYFEVGDQDSYMLQIANKNFNSFMATQGTAYTYNEFTGYGNYPADHFNYAFDRIVAILKFHSSSF